MKRLLATAMLLLGTACVAQAQLTAPIVTNDKGNVARDFPATSAAKTTLLDSLSATDTLFLPAAKPANTFAAPGVATALALPLETAEPAAPSPKPKFLYGGRDDYRWQLGFGITWLRFQNSVFHASAIGIKTSVTYFLNDWFGVEGNVSAAFAPQIFAREHVKVLLYGAGPKIAWRQKKWEPWLHGIVGGAHEQPQTAAGGRNAFGIQLGGGADYRFNPRFSGRLEGDYIRTSFFGQSQNNYQAVAGIVVHF